MTAAAYTGPAKHPRPASSQPASVYWSWKKIFSKKETFAKINDLRLSSNFIDTLI